MRREKRKRSPRGLRSFECGHDLPAAFCGLSPSANRSASASRNDHALGGDNHPAAVLAPYLFHAAGARQAGAGFDLDDSSAAFDQRDAIDLLKLKELSLKEASSLTGRSVAALKVATHRAMKRLRKLLPRDEAS